MRKRCLQRFLARAVDSEAIEGFWHLHFSAYAIFEPRVALNASARKICWARPGAFDSCSAPLELWWRRVRIGVRGNATCRNIKRDELHIETATRLQSNFVRASDNGRLAWRVCIMRAQKTSFRYLVAFHVNMIPTHPFFVFDENELKIGSREQQSLRPSIRASRPPTPQT